MQLTSMVEQQIFFFIIIRFMKFNKAKQYLQHQVLTSFRSLEDSFVNH